MTITHAFTSGKSDGADTTLVRASNWNADHVIGDGTLAINASSSVATFTLSANSLVALTLGTTNAVGSFSHLFDLGNNDSASLEIKSSWAGAGGPSLEFYHNSASPAASDTPGYISFYGNNTTPALVELAEFNVSYAVATAGAEQSEVRIFAMQNGSINAVLALNVNDTDHGESALNQRLVIGGGTNSEMFRVWGTNNLFMHFDNNSGSSVRSQFAVSSTSGGLGTVTNHQFSISANNADVIKVLAGVQVGSPTGGDKGAGTLNAVGVYAQGTLLTCYVDEAYKTGTVDLEYWDNKVPNTHVPESEEYHNGKTVIRKGIPAHTIVNTHGPARKFLSRLGTKYDPTTLAGQRLHLSEKKHLTPYQNPDKFTDETRPDLGSWVQCGVEMDELLFLYISQLEDRIKVLEADANIHSN